ncbi:MAG: M23 family metallopeptidase [Candidatus Edwardsbacteria bacterium]|jgi:murein DD-endopeptidase MepM/ murein hydrolase activator NlpD|nr:M23 family metallopeptidase [Candidatus Edwardsbacteria bacterium]
MILKEKTFFSVVFIPHHGGKPFTFRMARWMAFSLLGFGAFLLLGLGLVTTGYINKFVDVSYLQKLQIENRILSERLGDYAAKAGALERRMADLVAFDAKLRMAAGLDPIDPDIRKVGVGGYHQPALPADVRTATADRLLDIDQEIGRLEREARLQRESFEELENTLSRRRDLLAHLPSIQPAPGWITSDFGMRFDPFTGQVKMHEGLDIAAPEGTLIVAPADGEVKYAGYRGNFGMCLEIDHGYGLVTRYGHCLLLKASLGQRVSRGQPVALVGQSGRATGPHLHYEVAANGTVVDPQNYIMLPRMF